HIEYVRILCGLEAICYFMHFLPARKGRAYMPRKTDKNAQRAMVADVLNNIVARQGLDAVTMRTVATGAGCSVGAIQKYFRNKDDMLVFAMRHAIDRFVERSSPPINPHLNHQGFLNVLVSDIAQTLPLDDISRAEALVWSEFTA